MAWKSAIRSNVFGMATARPMPTTSFATDPTFRSGRKITRSSSNPINGAMTKTLRTTAGRIPMCAPVASTWSLKYKAADAYAWAPKARLNTPDVLYVSTNPRATSAYTAPAGMPCNRARKKSVPTEAANTMRLLYPLLEVHGRRVVPARLLRIEADPRLVRRPADDLEGAVLLHLYE